MTRVPRPPEFLSDLDRIRTLLDELADEYRWAYELAFGPGGSSSYVGVRVRTQSGDATLGQVIRGQDAANRARKAVGNANKALKLLQEAGGRDMLGPFRSVISIAEASHDAMVTPNQLQDARDHQARRRAQGRGWGQE